MAQIRGSRPGRVQCGGDPARPGHARRRHALLLAKTSGECIVRIKRRSRFGQFGPVWFHFTDSADLEVGTAVARGVMKTLRLTLQTEQGRQLLLTRWGHLSAEWLLTETDPRRSPAPETLGRVTVSDVDGG